MINNFYLEFFHQVCLLLLLGQKGLILGLQVFLCRTEILSYSKAELPDSQTYPRASVILEQKCGEEGVFDTGFSLLFSFPKQNCRKN